MKRSLSILLMLPLTLIPGELRAEEPIHLNEVASASPGRALVTPAFPSIGEQLPLFSYTFLGVEVRAFTDDEFREYRKTLARPPRAKNGIISYKPGDAAFLRRREGVLITHIEPGSPAEAAGLKVGEVLMRIGGAAMNSPADLLIVMRNGSPGIPMHMSLIDLERRWKNAKAVPIARPEPVQVGHIVPLELNKENMWRMQTHHVNAIRALASDPVPMKEACDELEAVCRLIYKGYTPGCLQLPLRTDGCRITATRNGWNIDVQMVENGVETRATLRHYEGPHVLPEPIRKRLQEVDTTAPAPPSRWEEQYPPAGQETQGPWSES